ncbi:MAG: hypothetical protein KGD60_05740 [Candidatus Thorarchaeota archaeon]|nr:hypothetical protein [Candidatus Thorarchaeota archaeon]
MEDSSDIHNLAKRYAPILHFHPEEGEFCCFPSDAEETYNAFHTNWDLFVEDRRPKELLSATPCYYEYWEDSKLTQIRYWFWFRYNDFPGAPLSIGKHVGDWENVEIRLYGSTKLEDAVWVLSNHYEARVASYSKTLQGFSREDVILNDEHINVWSALGTHANYPSPSSKPRCYVRFFCDKIADGGAIWNTRENLKSIDKTNFCTFEGRWGDKKAPRGPANEYNNRWRNALNLDPQSTEA